MRFYTADLLSKWGFDDGDLIDNFLESHNYPTCVIDSTPLWQRIFAERVLPMIQNDIEFKWMPSLHNSARAKTVDGQTIDHTASEHPGVSINPEYVDVPDDVVLRWANELRDRYLAIPHSAILAGMASGDDFEVREAFTAMQLRGLRSEDRDVIAATCADERVDESIRRRIRLALSNIEKNA